MSKQSLLRSAFAENANPISLGSSGNGRHPLIEKSEKTRRGEEVPTAVGERRLGFRVRAPLFELPPVVEADGVPSLVRGEEAVENPEAGDKRPADGDERRQAREAKG